MNKQKTNYFFLLVTCIVTSLVALYLISQITSSYDQLIEHSSLIKYASDGKKNSQLVALKAELLSDLSKHIPLKESENISYIDFFGLPVSTNTQNTEIHIYDSIGRHTGPLSYIEDFNLAYEEKVPGVTFSRNGNFKEDLSQPLYTLDISGEHDDTTIVLKGRKFGITRVTIGEPELADGAGVEIFFPIGPKSTVSIPLTKGNLDIGPLFYDFQGDGISDVTISLNDDMSSKLFLELTMVLVLDLDITTQLKLEIWQNLSRLVSEADLLKEEKNQSTEKFLHFRDLIQVAANSLKSLNLDQKSKIIVQVLVEILESTPISN